MYDRFSKIVDVSEESIKEFIFESNALDFITDKRMVKRNKHYHQHREAFDFLFNLSNYNKKENKIPLEELHFIIMRGIVSKTSRFIGKYRNKNLKSRTINHPVVEELPVSLIKLNGLIKKAMKDKDISPWDIHNEFIRISPFMEYNGRLARLVLNTIYMRHNPGKMLIIFNEELFYYNKYIEESLS